MNSRLASFSVLLMDVLSEQERSRSLSEMSEAKGRTETEIKVLQVSFQGLFMVVPNSGDKSGRTLE